MAEQMAAKDHSAAERAVAEAEPQEIVAARQAVAQAKAKEAQVLAENAVAEAGSAE